MKDCSPSVAPIVKGDGFHMEQCPKTDFEREQMINIPYAPVVWKPNVCLGCTRPNIAFVIGILSRFHSNQSMKYWKAAKTTCLCIGKLNI